MAVIPVSRLAADIAEEDLFDRFVRPRRPFVLAGAAREWPCVREWSLESLCCRYPEDMVDFVEVASGARNSRRLGDYPLLPEAERSHTYVCDWDFRKTRPELARALHPIPQLRVDWIQDIPPAQRPDLLWIYIGHAGTRGPTHADNYGTSAWLTVCEGTKRLRFHPERGKLKAPVADLFTDPPEGTLEAELQAGDIAYVPAGRWHAAWNDTNCTSVTGNILDAPGFIEHRAFYLRAWHGRRQLVSSINAIGAADPGPYRDQLVRHVREALRLLQAHLQSELAELDTFEKVLEDHLT